MLNSNKRMLQEKEINDNAESNKDAMKEYIYDSQSSLLVVPPPHENTPSFLSRAKDYLICMTVVIFMVSSASVTQRVCAVAPLFLMLLLLGAVFASLYNLFLMLLTTTRCNLYMVSESHFS